MTIAIIGAGMAGLSAAQALSVAGKTVRLFDKGRGPGGRMSTRRAETLLGQVRFDHGAQFMTPESEAFKGAIDKWVELGAAALWSGAFVSHTNEGGFQEDKSDRFVGVPGMNGIIRSMASDLDVEWGRRVVDLFRTDGVWTLKFEDGTAETGFQSVIIAAPLEQARDLYALVQADGAATLFPETVSDPAWALMIAFDEGVDVAWDAARFSDGAISWLACNRSKPQRGELETWVAHASLEWSRDNLERDKADVAADLGAAVRKILGVASPVFMSAHRWRYSQINNSPEIGSMWLPELSIGLCGDWCLGPRIEHAWLSGRDIVNKNFELYL